MALRWDASALKYANIIRSNQSKFFFDTKAYADVQNIQYSQGKWKATYEKDDDDYNFPENF